jgi:hypothetical protein
MRRGISVPMMLLRAVPQASMIVVEVLVSLILGDIPHQRILICGTDVVGKSGVITA